MIRQFPCFRPSSGILENIAQIYGRVYNIHTQKDYTRTRWYTTKENVQMGSSASDIAYQNKDIVSKILADNFKNKSLAVYGLDIPKIVKVLPTNLPEIFANELRIDHIFELEDKTVCIIDYESSYKKENFIKYLQYMARVLERYRKENIYDVKLRMVVIYTADVLPGQTETVYDAGTLSYHIEPAFLSSLDSEKIKKRISEKIMAKEHLSDEELMEFIILPLTYKNAEKKKKELAEMIALAKEIRSEKECLFVLSGMLVFADKIIDVELSRQVKEWIRMTKVGKLYEQEKIEYANKQRENDIIDMSREDGKTDEEIIIRLKKRLGYDERKASEAVASYDSRQPASV